MGPLGAGYLVSVHTVQYLLLTFVTPPLLVSGTSRATLRALLQRQWISLLARQLTRPLIAFAIFNLVMLATHLPQVVDGLAKTQIGSFAVAMSWLGAGLVFWWQVLAPLPELNPLPVPGRIVFLIVNIFIPIVPASFLTFADYPIYRLYELAPPIDGVSTRVDQQIAGLLMKIVGGFTIFGIATVLFFRWSAEEERTA